MKNKFIEWFGRNRKTIGYIIGGVNLGSGIGYLITGDVTAGIAWLIIGAFIVVDTKEFK
tara:strand:- start:280 stop:456 length:177 start_codon:yes stop_codon:yes gene_type:complete